MGVKNAVKYKFSPSQLLAYGQAFTDDNNLDIREGARAQHAKHIIAVPYADPDAASLVSQEGLRLLKSTDMAVPLAAQRVVLDALENGRVQRQSFLEHPGLKAQFQDRVDTQEEFLPNEEWWIQALMGLGYDVAGYDFDKSKLDPKAQKVIQRFEPIRKQVQRAESTNEVFQLVDKVLALFDEFEVSPEQAGLPGGGSDSGEQSDQQQEQNGGQGQGEGQGQQGQSGQSGNQGDDGQGQQGSQSQSPSQQQKQSPGQSQQPNRTPPPVSNPLKDPYKNPQDQLDKLEDKTKNKQKRDERKEAASGNGAISSGTRPQQPTSSGTTQAPTIMPPQMKDIESIEKMDRKGTVSLENTPGGEGITHVSGMRIKFVDWREPQRGWSDRGEKTYYALQAAINYLSRSMLILLQSKDRTGMNYGEKSGTVDTRRAYKLGGADFGIFRQPVAEKDTRPVILMTTDMSGSMGNISPGVFGQDTAEEERHLEVTASYHAMRSSMVIAGALAKLRIPFEQHGFESTGTYYNGGNMIYVFKGFSDSWGLRVSRAMGRLSGGDGGTPAAEALLAGWARLLCRNEPRKILIMVTDGGIDSDVKDVVKNIEKAGGIVIGVCVGQYGDESMKMFSYSFTVKTVSEMPGKFSALLKKLLNDGVLSSKGKR